MGPGPENRACAAKESEDDSRPVLTGVYLKIEDNRYEMASADGFRLAVARGQVENASQEVIELVVPGATIRELTRRPPSSEDVIQIQTNVQRSLACFKFRGHEMTSSLIQGTFPNYQQLIPQTHENLAEFPV